MALRLRLPILTAAILAASTIFAAAQSAARTEAQKAADVMEEWGLVGTWSHDCRLAPMPSAPLLTYTKAGDGSVIRTATVGRGGPNTSLILSARKMPDGSLEITEKDSRDTMTYVLSKDASGKYRSMSSHDAKGQYYIRDGKFVDDGKTTPLLARCQ